MKRIIVLGGLGQFGRTVAEELRLLGMQCMTASRRGDTDLHVDANDAASIRSKIRSGDIVIDAAGPFHSRSTALVEAANDVGFDVIDINDDLSYAEAVFALAPRIDSAGIRVLSSASSVSAVAAAVVGHSGIESPHRVTAFLAPASRHTANAGAAKSLIRSIGRPVRVFRNGQLTDRVGWNESKTFCMPQPLGTIHGRLFESADAIHLPRIWPTLQDVSIYVDTNTLGVNTLLHFATHARFLRRLLEHQARLGTWIARMFGSEAGGIGYEIEDSAGLVTNWSIVADKNSFITAVAPAVLAAKSIAEDRYSHIGLVSPDRHVEPKQLFAFLESRGIALHTTKAN